MGTAYDPLAVKPHDRPHFNSFFLRCLDSRIGCDAVPLGGDSDRGRFMDRTDRPDFRSDYSIGGRNCAFCPRNTRSHPGLSAFSSPAIGKEKRCLTAARFGCGLALWRSRFARSSLIVTRLRQTEMFRQNVPTHVGFWLLL